MTDDKRATLKKLLLTTMTIGALGRISGHHVAHAQGVRATGGTAALGGGVSGAATDASGAPVSNVAVDIDNLYDQTWGEVFPETWFIEIFCW